MQSDTGRRDAAILDDDEIHLEVLAAALRRYNFGTIHRATGGLDGIEIISRHRASIRLVISDLCMPDADGIEIQSELYRLVPSAPLLIISGTQPNLTNAAAILAESAGIRVLGVLGKPLELVKLHQILDAELSDLRSVVEQNGIS